jgi:NarL family two-component system sensor histidine kinase YdfH
MKSRRKWKPVFWLLLWFSPVFLLVGWWGEGLVKTNLIPLVTMVLALHIGIYWINSSLQLRHRWPWYALYFGLQALLAWMISLILREYQGLAYAQVVGVVVTLSLYLSLIGEAVVWFRRLPLLAMAVAVSYLLLLGFSLSTGFQVKGESTLLWIYNLVTLLLVPVTPFLVGYVLSSARRRDEALLEELKLAHAQLAAYATRVEDLTRTTERQRLARELHDTLAQGLTGVILQLEATNSRLQRQRYEQAQASVQEALACARTALATARYAIDDLRADASSPETLQQTIQEEIDRFTTATGIACRAELAALGLLPPEFSETIVRVVREGLTNVACHAQAQQVWMQATASLDGWLFEIGDDGVGFDPDALLHTPGHYGLLGLRERARLAGGHLDVTSQPGAGATLHLHLPRSGDMA